MHPSVLPSSAAARPGWGAASAVHKALRNTHALLSLTLLFSAAVAASAVAFGPPAPGLVLTLAGYLGLLFLIHKMQNSAAAIPAVFALTGFMGYTLGPVLSSHLALAGGAQTIALALGATGATFLALSGWVMATRRDFCSMGGILFAGMVIAILAGLGALLFQMPAMGLAVSAMVALLSAGLILFETSRIVHGGETNYVMAKVSLFAALFNLFTSLLSLFDLGTSND